MADLINELNAALGPHASEPQNAGRGLAFSATPNDADALLNVAPSSDRTTTITPSSDEPGYKNNLSSDELGYKANRFTSLLEDLTRNFGVPVMNSPSTKLDDSPIESSLPTDDPEICDIVREFIPRLRTRVTEMRHHLQVGNLNKVKGARSLAGRFSGKRLGLACSLCPRESWKRSRSGTKRKTSTLCSHRSRTSRSES